ncbi:MAG: hypothetical protein OEM96_04460, partial [Gemmatimonadota bacterium]|nr:hypothetical protein [Gemmatimonadota bacterium]
MSEQAGGRPTAVDVSVIVSVTERPVRLAELYREYSAALTSSGRQFEFIFVVEPWHKGSLEGLRALADQGDPIRIVESRHVIGESAMLKLAATQAQGRTLVLLPAYYRVVASAIPEIVAAVEGGADLANCRRWPRRDSWFNRIQTRVLHSAVTGLPRTQVRDVGSGVRAMRPEVLRDLPLYGDFFRFLPVLALRDGYSVVEVDAEQHPLDTALRIYPPGVYMRRAIDVFGLFFLSRFTYKPLRFFGLVGTLLSGIGALILMVMFVQRLGGRGLADRPLLLLGVLIFTLGVQAIAL